MQKRATKDHNKNSKMKRGFEYLYTATFATKWFPSRHG